jgi:RimJ/RimL family protein N-acetyltransferase
VGPFTLEGHSVRLIPLSGGHVHELLTAATADRSTFAFTPVPGDEASMVEYVASACRKREAGEHIPFVTFSKVHRRIVGSTRFYDLTPWMWEGPFAGPGGRQRVDRPDVATIGYTWLEPAAQRSPVNTEAKVLMLDHAFDTWDVYAVRIQTDARNQRSRAAIERLGFTLDGVIRADKPGADGTVRDSATFSMLAEEWPVHRSRLATRLAWHTQEGFL